jgi:hypothetical protein
MYRRAWTDFDAKRGVERAIKVFLGPPGASRLSPEVFMRLLLVAALLLPGCRNKDTTGATGFVDSVPTVDSQGSHDTETTSETGLPIEPADADQDGWPDDQDCAPEDPDIHPDAQEICNGIDDDCDTLIDDDDPDNTGTATWWIDADEDGHGSAAYSVEACAEPDGFAATDDDCDDSEPLTSPDANEICDDDDNDCDERVDENADDAGTWYRDADSDGYGDPADSVQDCDGEGDTVADATDCDDTDPAIHPGQDETCNGVDDDCDGSTDDDDDDVTDQGTWYPDTDGDGHGDPGSPTLACESPSQHVADATDCDDGDAAVSPSAAEICDGADQDCDTLVDDDDPDVTGTSTWYIDFDGDGYGSSDYTVSSCEAPSGYVANSDDCEDAHADASPVGTEVCDDLDNDCNGTVDDDATDFATWYADTDSDGYGDPSATSTACEAPSGSVDNGRDCDDSDAAVSPSAAEVCNGVDDDCNGWTDAADPGISDASTWYLDYDGDGYGSAVVTTTDCDQPTGYTDNTDDCNDLVAGISPDGTEACNGQDDDCDGDTDEPDASDAPTWYADTDGDGYGDPTSTDVACEANSGFIENAEDCDDASSAAYPGAPESCDATADLDCDGTTSDGCSSCAEILATGGASGDGLYDVDPDGTSGPLAETSTWCEMTTDGGGWTLVQRTVWDWADSGQLLTGFSDWATVSVGDPGVGTAWRFEGQAWPDLLVDGDMLIAHTLRRDSDGVSCDPLYYTGSGASFAVDTASATATLSGLVSSVVLANTTELSTTDSGSGSSCPTDNNAVPWFYTSCCTTCPTFGGAYWSGDPHPMASYMAGTADLNGQVAADVCGGDAPAASNGYYGDNMMEIYLR